MGLARLFALLGFIVLLFGWMKISWGMGGMRANEWEIDAIFSAFNIVITIIFILMFHRIFSQTKLVYVLYTYWVLMLLSFYDKISSLGQANFMSSLMLLLVFGYIALYSNYYLRKAGIAGIFYSLTSLVFLVLLRAGYGFKDIFWLGSTLILCLVLYFIYLDLDKIELDAPKKRIKLRKMSNLKYILRSSLIILLFLVFAMLSTYSIHEIGHALVAKFYGCEVKEIVLYDMGGSSHTEIKCIAQYNSFLLSLAGIMLTTLIGLIFMMANYEMTNYLSYVVIGLGMLIGNSDLKEAALSQSLIFLIWATGIIIMIYGAVKLTMHYLRNLENSAIIARPDEAQGILATKQKI